MLRCLTGDRTPTDAACQYETRVSIESLVWGYRVSSSLILTVRARDVDPASSQNTPSEPLYLYVETPYLY